MRKPSNRILVLCFAVLVATAAVYLSVHSTVAPPIPDGDYSIRSRSTNLVVDDPFSSRNSGEQMIRWDWNNGLNQKWHFTHQGRGYYTIQNMKSGLFLTAPGGPTDRGVPLQQQKARNDDSQKWLLDPVGSGFVIENKARHLFVDDSASGSKNGSGIVLSAEAGLGDRKSSWAIK